MLKDVWQTAPPDDSHYNQKAKTPQEKNDKDKPEKNLLHVVWNQRILDEMKLCKEKTTTEVSRPFICKMLWDM